MFLRACRANYSVVLSVPRADACHSTQTRTYVTYHSVGSPIDCPRSCVISVGDDIIININITIIILTPLHTLCFP
jgi:hypothetical protein